MIAAPRRSPVFFASLSALCYEVLLNRAFAITQWSHLTFLVISIALFGYSAGGLWVHIRTIKASSAPDGKAVADGREIKFSLLLAASILVSWLCANGLPFDSIQLPFSAVQIFYLFVLYLLLAIPFFFAGYITTYVFWKAPDKIGLIYAATMLGSAVGALVPALLLPIAGFRACVIIAGCISTVPALLSHRRRGIVAAVAVGLCVLMTSFLFFPALMEPKASSYKDLEQQILHPGAAITHSHESIYGRVNVLESPSIRYAPGLSLNFTGTLPGQRGVFVDNSLSLVVSDIVSLEDLSFATASLAHAPVVIHPDPSNILVAVGGGGNLLLSALSIKNAAVTILDHIPERRHLIDKFYPSPLWKLPRGPARVAIRSIESRFDMIFIDHIGSSNPALSSIYEDFLLTKESFASLFSRLSDNGVMFLVRKLLVPPSDSLKVAATAYYALREAGIPDPTLHFAVLRSWDTYSLMVTKYPLDDRATSALREFATERSFYLVYLPDIRQSEANRYSRRPVAAHYQAMAALLNELRNGEPAFSINYYINIRPATDNRPFVNNLIRWSKIDELYEATGERFYTMLFSGEVLIVAAFLVALILSIVFVIVPVYALAGMRKDRRFTSLEPRAFRLGATTLFLILGAGYMFFEIAWIKKFILISGSPSLSFTAVLGIVLISSGLGGLISRRIKKQQVVFVGLLAAVLVIATLPVMKFTIPALLNVAHPLPLILGCCLLIPSAVFMGMPLPLAMKWVCTTARMRIAGWVANGVASVLSSIAAAAIALLLGIIELLALAGAMYVVVAIMLVLLRSRGNNVST